MALTPPSASRNLIRLRATRERMLLLLQGILLGVLFSVVNDWVGPSLTLLPPMRVAPTILLLAGLFGVLSYLGALRLVWWLTGLQVALLLVVAYTPWFKGLPQGWAQEDPPQHAPAVVVLSSNIRPDGRLTDAAQIRVLKGYEMLRTCGIPRLVLTHLRAPKPPYLPTVSEQMRVLGLDAEVEEVGPVRDTHDEAVVIGELCRKRGWERVMIVSDALHMRRAKAVFRKAGVETICVPCLDRKYDLGRLTKPSDRVEAFSDWLYEVMGYQTYRARGWI